MMKKLGFGTVKCTHRAKTHESIKNLKNCKYSMLGFSEIFCDLEGCQILSHFAKINCKMHFYAVAPEGYFASKLPACKVNGGGTLEYTFLPRAKDAGSSNTNP